MQYWEEFERVLEVFMKLALLKHWDYPVPTMREHQGHVEAGETAK